VGVRSECTEQGGTLLSKCMSKTKDPACGVNVNATNHHHEYLLCHRRYGMPNEFRQNSACFESSCVVQTWKEKLHTSYQL
jgi:hypothetical protein